MLDEHLRNFFVYAIQEAEKGVMPEDEFPSSKFSVNTQYLPPRLLVEDERGYRAILVEDMSEYRILMEMIQESYTWITDEYIEKAIEHETEHLDEARKICESLGDWVHYYYGVCFLERDKGDIGIQPFYQLLYRNAVLSKEDKLRILEAPRNHSRRDSSSIAKLEED